MALLNLARSWRSKTFDEVIGQDLTIRLIKNSLYRNLLFPVYLLAGQRGCGKTSVGRLLAAAINCSSYEAFCQNPHSVSLPCLTCDSCKAAVLGSHPDIHEIDAASHTGVDHVRSIVEAASLLPVMGKKKIYLIDEAHMLSKAAFNALLKILEEPPVSALFILATTDPHKVIDTVRSRCFQLFFNPVSPLILQKHLIRICQQEGIAAEPEALLLIAYESEGSVRDAINILERVRLAFGDVKASEVQELLGHLAYATIIDLCIIAITQSPEDLLKKIHATELHTYEPRSLWKKIVEIIRAALWLQQGIGVSGINDIYKEQLRPLSTLSITQLIACLDLWYQAEPLFLRTHNAHALLELLMMRMNSVVQRRVPSPQKEPAVVEKTEPTEPWAQFLQTLEKGDDPLLLSVFRQGTFNELRDNKISITFPEQLVFFTDVLEETKTQWQPVIEKIFGKGTVLVPQFTKVVPSVKPELKSPPPPAPTYRAASKNSLDVRDREQWKKVHEVLRVFPGTVTEDKV